MFFTNFENINAVFTLGSFNAISIGFIGLIACSFLQIDASILNCLEIAQLKHKTEKIQQCEKKHENWKKFFKFLKVDGF